MDTGLAVVGLAMEDVFQVWKDRKEASGSLVLVRFGRDTFFVFAGDAGAVQYAMDTWQVDTNFVRNSTIAGYYILDGSHTLAIRIEGRDKAKEFVWGLTTHGYSVFVHDLGI